MHGTSTNPVDAFLILYGMTYWSDYIDPRLYDPTLTEQMFEFDTENMKMKTNLDLDNHKIMNLSDGSDANDAVNKGQLDVIGNKLNTLTPFVKNHRYIKIFENNYYDLVETGHFELSRNVTGVVITGILPNSHLGTKRFISNYSPRNGLILSSGGYINTVKTLNQNSSFTFFMSFFHTRSKTCQISFVNTQSGIKYHPYYKLVTNKRIIDTGSSTYETQFTSNFEYKKYLFGYAMMVQIIYIKWH